MRRDRAPVEIQVSQEDEGKRLDVYVARRLALSRSAVQRLLEEGLVSVEGRPGKPATRVRVGEQVRVVIPEPERVETLPEDLPLDVLYEDDDIIVVNKPRGLVVHPAAGNWSGTLVNRLLAHCRDLSGVGGRIRPGIVHRLDRGTSGVLMAAKNDHAHLALARDLKERRVVKEYLAVVHGVPREDTGTVDAPIGRHPRDRKKMAVIADGAGRARPSVTTYEVVERLHGHALLRVHPITGRTHQIRVHLAHIGHPVVGDTVYGARRPTHGIAGQALHAASIEIAHPRTGERMTFSAPLPEDMSALLDMLRRSQDGRS